MHIAKNVKWLVKNFLDMMLLERNIAKFEKHREEFVANGYIVHQPWKVLDNFSHFPPRKLLKFICPKKGRSALYNYCEMMQDINEFEQLYEIMKSISPQRALEIGTANGGTLFCLAHIVTERLISIDTPLGIHNGGYSKYRKEFYQVFEGLLPKLKVNLIHADSRDVSTVDKVHDILRNNLLDILFIDGDHTLEGVRNDYFNYKSFVRKGGLIIFHNIDANWTENLAVGLLWRELRSKHLGRYTEIKLNPRMGVGILEV